MTLSPQRFVVCAVLSVALSVVGGVLGILLYLRLVVDLEMNRQRLSLVFPEGFHAEADIQRPVPIHIEGLVKATVPIDQTFTLPLRGSYVAYVAFKTTIPVKTQVTYRGSVPIRAEANLHGTTALVVDLPLLPRFDLRARVPLSFDLPVTLAVPIDTQVALDYRGSLRFALDQSVALPIATDIKTRFAVNRSAQAPVLATVGMQVKTPLTGTPVVIERARLQLPLSQLSLARNQP